MVQTFVKQNGKTKNPHNIETKFAIPRWKRTTLLISLNLSVNYMDLHPAKKNKQDIENLCVFP